VCASGVCLSACPGCLAASERASVWVCADVDVNVDVDVVGVVGVRGCVPAWVRE